MLRVVLAAAATAAVALGVIAARARAAPGADDEYSITHESPTSLRPGVSATIKVSLSPAAGRTISSDGPVQIVASVAPATGLRLPRTRFRRRHARQPEASALEFDIEAVGDDAGAYQIALDIRFWICASKTCRPVRERRQIEVTVEAANGGADAGATPTEPRGR